MVHVSFMFREDVSKMEYLTMCIKEGMRDHCPVPFIQREFTHDFEINGHKFPRRYCLF